MLTMHSLATDGIDSSSEEDRGAEEAPQRCFVKVQGPTTAAVAAVGGEEIAPFVQDDEDWVFIQ
jgi:hypothetical protein